MNETVGFEDLLFNFLTELERKTWLISKRRACEKNKHLNIWAWMQEEKIDLQGRLRDLMAFMDSQLTERA